MLHAARKVPKAHLASSRAMRRTASDSPALPMSRPTEVLPLNTGNCMAQATHGPAAAQRAATPHQEESTPAPRCCASSFRTSVLTAADARHRQRAREEALGGSNRCGAAGSCRFPNNGLRLRADARASTSNIGGDQQLNWMVSGCGLQESASRDFRSPCRRPPRPGPLATIHRAIRQNPEHRESLASGLPRGPT